jgi:hypothetical protein
LSLPSRGNIAASESRLKREVFVTREELTALRDAIELTLALPDSVRLLLA